ncbi:MAG: hypothetical protein FQY80_05175, partial [Ornithobacterium rhinotracheale]|nr:hypothetical protein [Ornithobacterium rhinotracheale]
LKPKFHLGALALCLYTSFYLFIKRCFCSAPHCKILFFTYSHGTSFLVECFFSYLIFLVERPKELWRNVRYENSRHCF